MTRAEVLGVDLVRPDVDLILGTGRSAIGNHRTDHINQTFKLNRGSHDDSQGPTFSRSRVPRSDRRCRVWWGRDRAQIAVTGRPDVATVDGRHSAVAWDRGT